jgi:hypothetical protein
VVEAEDPDAAVKKAGRLGKPRSRSCSSATSGCRPRGTSFQGGFEVVKRLWKMNLRPPVLLMGEALTPTLQARARQMEIANFVFKPGLSKLDPEQFEADLRAFATKILTDLLPKLGAAASAARSSRTEAREAEPAAGAPRGASAKAPAPAAPTLPPATADEMSRDFEQLQRWLEELRGCQDATQISALVMRVARDCFERGVLFVVKHETMRGLGGYGAPPATRSSASSCARWRSPWASPPSFPAWPSAASRTSGRGRTTSGRATSWARSGGSNRPASR